MDNAPLMNAMDRMALESLFWNMLRTAIARRDPSISFVLPPNPSADGEESLPDIGMLTDKMMQIIGKDEALAEQLNQLFASFRLPEVQAMIGTYAAFTHNLQKNPEMLRVIQEMVGGV